MTQQPDNRYQYWPDVPYETAGDTAMREQAETERKRQVDVYGLALMMIREGVADPKEVAREALEKFGGLE